ncbi:MAG: F0F1 ATP synthase subunit epsilon [Planctomycetota bacterium]
MPDAYRCTLITPEQEVFTKQVTYVDLPAHDGQMGFQVRRAPALVKLGKGLLTVTETGGAKTAMQISGGFAQMKGDDLSILTDEAKDPS